MRSTRVDATIHTRGMSGDAAETTAAAKGSWSVCPGCGVTLPAVAGLRARSNASESCWQLYGEVAAYTSAHLATLGRLHQLTVDAYGAQHAGGSAAPIGVAFALIGLRLSLDEGWQGDEVRSAHQYLAATFKDWPEFAPPSRGASVTAFDVAMTDSPEAHAQLVRRWAADVWASWGTCRDEVVALIEARLPVDVRGRLRAAR